VFASAGKGF